MSATADRSVKHMFIYSDLYQVYKTGEGENEVFAVIKKRKEQPKSLSPFESLKENLKKLTNLRFELSAIIKKLEEES